jgi:hypothetical protein
MVGVQQLRALDDDAHKIGGQLDLCMCVCVFALFDVFDDAHKVGGQLDLCVCVFALFVV